MFTDKDEADINELIDVLVNYKPVYRKPEMKKIEPPKSRYSKNWGARK